MKNTNDQTEDFNVTDSDDEAGCFIWMLIGAILITITGFTLLAIALYKTTT